jgi:hypothetical protein
LHEEEENKIQKDLGSLNVAIIYFKSELMFLVGSSENEKISERQFILWNDKLKMKLASIKLNEDIIDLVVDKFTFYIILRSKILVFQIIGFKFVCALQDFNVESLNDHKYAISRGFNNQTNHNLKSNYSIITYVSNLNTRQLKINKLKFFKNDKTICKFQISILIKDVLSIQFIESDEKGELVAVVSQRGIKIRIYSLIDYQCKFLLWRGYSDAIIKKICFDDKNRYMGLISNKLTFHFYKLYRRRNSPLSYSDFENKKNLDCTYFSNSSDEEDQNFLKELFYDLKVNLF